MMTRVTRFIHVSSSPLFALELHVFPTDPPLASKMLRQLRCIEALESAIGILNAEYENVELVKGEVGKLKDPKGLDDDIIYLKHLCIFVPMYLNLRFSIQMGFHFGTITSLGWLRRLKNK